MRQPMIPSMTRLSCGTIRCQINGTYVPVAEFELAAGDWIYFSPKVLLWTDPATTLTIPQPSRSRRPGMMEAHGPGNIGVAGNRAGEVIALPLRRAQPACVHPGRFLCATGNVKYRWQSSEVSYITMARVWVPTGAGVVGSLGIQNFCSGWRDGPAGAREFGAWRRELA
jgi:hypothetical protein